MWRIGLPRVDWINVENMVADARLRQVFTRILNIVTKKKAHLLWKICRKDGKNGGFSLEIWQVTVNFPLNLNEIIWKMSPRNKPWWMREGPWDPPKIVMLYESAGRSRLSRRSLMAGVPWGTQRFPESTTHGAETSWWGLSHMVRICQDHGIRWT